MASTELIYHREVLNENIFPPPTAKNITKIYIFRSEKTVFSFNIFPSPFNTYVEITVPDELQMELIYLQNDTELRNKFQNVDIHNFYQNYFH